MIVLLTAAGISINSTESLLPYAALYGPFLLAIWLFTRYISILHPEPQAALWPNPTIPQMIFCTLFTTGAIYIGLLISKGSNYFISPTLFLSAPSLLLTVSFSGLLSFQTFGSVVLAPILEEYIYRRMIQDKLLYWGEGAAILLTSVFFSLVHLEGDRLIDTFLCGLIFGYIYSKTGKMRWNILLHGVTNAIGILYNRSYLVSPLVLVAMIYVPIYLIRHRPWKKLFSGDSGLSVGAKSAACLANIGFWVCVACCLALIIFVS